MRKRKMSFALALSAASWFTYATPQTVLAATSDMPSSATSPCSEAERWDFNPAIPGDVRIEFGNLLNGATSPARGFSEALAYRKDTPPGESRALSEYWISRALLKAGLTHAAYSGFLSIATAKPTVETLGARLAALECATRLRQTHPSLQLPSELGDHLREQMALAESEKQQRVIRDAATLLLKQQIEQRRSKEELARTVNLLRGGGAHEALAKGMVAALSGEHAKTATEMERFLMAQAKGNERIESLDRHVDQAHLLAARAYFSQGKYDASIRHYKAVRTSSNDFPEALSELAWAQLMKRNYGEAIGAALGLQAGGLRRTFAPEAPSVLAMAMNELCQYPESLRASEQFRRGYEPSYNWLTQWSRGSKAERENLQPLALDFLKRKKKDRKAGVPDQVASQWVRSPLFQVSQDELNLLVDLPRSVQETGRSAAREQKAMGREILAESSALIRRLRAERAKGYTAALKADVERMVTQIAHYRRFRSAAPIWRGLASGQQSMAVASRQQALRRMNQELASLNHTMLLKLEEIAENTRMVEAEIYDGASRDIIWQNAHPDYKEVAKKLHDEQHTVAAAKVWNWGQAPIGSDSWTEIWEDELGSFKSSVFDNCSSKEKYLAIKKQGSVRLTQR